MSVQVVTATNMALPTLPSDTNLATINEEDRVTRCHLQVNPMTAALAAPFAAFIGTNWRNALLLEMQLEDDLALASARILHADRVLNGLVKKVDTTLLLLTGKDRTAALYVQFFGQQRPFQVAAGILGPQLETMRGWVSLLLGSAHDALKALGAEVDQAVKDADAAVAAKKTAENALLVFATTGEGRKVIDDYNALRKSTYGELGKLQHQNPDLPNDFADSFFRHESRRGDDKLSPEQLKQQETLQKKLEAALARQKAEMEQKEADEQRRLALEAKKKEREELDAAIKKMEAEMKK
jgi:hypothetical protein